MLVNRIEAGVRMTAGEEIDLFALANATATIRCGGVLLLDAIALWMFDAAGNPMRPRLLEPVEVDVEAIEAVLTVPNGHKAPRMVVQLLSEDGGEVTIKDWRVEFTRGWTVYA